MIARKPAAVFFANSRCQLSEGALPPFVSAFRFKESRLDSDPKRYARNYLVLGRKVGSGSS